MHKAVNHLCILIIKWEDGEEDNLDILIDAHAGAMDAITTLWGELASMVSFKFKSGKSHPKMKSFVFALFLSNESRSPHFRSGASSAYPSEISGFSRKKSLFY